MKKFLRLIFISFIFILFLETSFSYDNSKDKDGDYVEDNIDLCIYTSKNEVVDSMGCSEEDKLIDTDKDTIPDYRDEDDDDDGIFDTNELLGYTGTYLGEQKFIITNPVFSDTDSDSWNDKIEFLKKTDPTNPDTDSDGINDSKDLEPLTSKIYIQFINSNGVCDDSCKTNYSRFEQDKDMDGVNDNDENPRCLDTLEGLSVYKDSGDYLGCSRSQKGLKIEFDDIYSSLRLQKNKVESAISTGENRNEEIEKFDNKYNEYISFINNIQNKSPLFYEYITSLDAINPLSLKEFVETNNIAVTGDAKKILTDGKPVKADVKVNDINNGNSTRGSHLDAFKQSGHFSGSATGEKGAKSLILNLAKDIKNVFIAIASIFLIILVIKLFFGGGGEDDLKKWRSGILWTSVGIIIMQISYVAVASMFDKSISELTAAEFSNSVLWPMIRLLEVLASFVFIAMAIYAFYRMITAGGNEDGYKKGVQTIISAIVGFILIKISSKLVYSVYGEVKCEKIGLGTVCNSSALGNPNLSDTVKIARSVIQYATSFLGIVVVILIIYAGFLILTGGGNEDKIKKSKNLIKYIIFGILLIVVSVSLFQFLGGADLGGVIGSFNPLK